jgi:hypothetical protein
MLTVEKHPIMPSRRNPFAIVEKHSLAVLLVEIHSLKPATGAQCSLFVRHRIDFNYSAGQVKQRMFTKPRGATQR